jgi:gamma-glutamyl:cysteine ligase YbdK (ATP-grasp superfamily)
MLEIIIGSSLEIVEKTERVLDAIGRHLRAGRLDDIPDLCSEVDLLTDVTLILDEAARMLRKTFEMRPEIARGSVHASLQ